MIAGALGYRHDYCIVDKKLVCIKGNAVSNSGNCYKTIFANIYEHNRGRVLRSTLDSVLHISLNVA
jgi:hypothetical protein